MKDISFPRHTSHVQTCYYILPRMRRRKENFSTNEHLFSIRHQPPLIQSNKFDGFSNAGRGAFSGTEHVQKRKTGSGKSRARNSTIVNTLSSRQRNFSQYITQTWHQISFPFFSFIFPIFWSPSDLTALPVATKAFEPIFSLSVILFRSKSIMSSDIKDA